MSQQASPRRLQDTFNTLAASTHLLYKRKVLKELVFSKYSYSNHNNGGGNLPFSITSQAGLRQSTVEEKPKITYHRFHLPL